MKTVIAVVLIVMLPPAWAQLTSEQQDAKEQGVIHFQMKKSNLAAPFLAVAASAGDRDSQYYMGEIERRKVMFMTAEAQQWYEKAAAHGDIYAMLRLASADQTLCILMENCAPHIKSPSEWAAVARSLATERAKCGDGEAMFQLYLLTGDFDWLIKSAKTGFPEGQDWLGVKYREGKGFFLTPGRRAKEVERLFRAAAKAGYVPAMENLFEVLPLKGSEKEVGY
jgi:TPR repeat protein